MSEQFEKIFEQARKISLRPDERARMREQILHFIKTHPVKSPEVEAFPQQRLAFSFLSFMRKPVPIVLAGVLILGGSLSAAAEKSLPGDTLYPVKLQVNEGVQEALTFSPQSSADLQMALAQKRLDEAEQLSAEGKLNSTVRGEVEANFHKHAQHVKDRVTALQAQGDTQAAADLGSTFEASLSAHEQILAGLEQNDQNEDNQITQLLGKVKVDRESTASVRAEDEAKVSAQTNVEQSVQASSSEAADAIAKARAYFDSVKGSLTTDVSTQGQAQLDQAAKAYADGSAKLFAKDYGAAFAKFQQSERIVRRLKLVLGAGFRFRLNLKFQDDNPSVNDQQQENKGQTHSGDQSQGSGGSKEDFGLRLNVFPTSTPSSTILHEKPEVESK
jgi:hypothetical protein